MRPLPSPWLETDLWRRPRAGSTPDQRRSTLASTLRPSSTFDGGGARRSGNPRLEIAGRAIDHESEAYVIAEIGHNPGGDVELAYQMILAAKDAGASAVKFQTRHPREVYAPVLFDKPFDSPHAFGPTVGLHREAIEFSPSDWAALSRFCAENGVAWFSTPFDHRSADLLADLDVPAFKIASGDATNTPLLEHVARYGKPVLVSTGGCTLADVERVVSVLQGAPFALLQCTCIYPTRAEDLNLEVISTYRRLFPETVIGLSHHHPHWLPNVAAFALGARIFEQHFTTSRELKGTDNAFSLTPPMLRDCVDALQATRAALGSASKTVLPVELAPATERQKSLYWARDLDPGHVVAEDDIVIQCPGAGLKPWQKGMVVGRTLTETVRAGELVAGELVANELVAGTTSP